MNIIERAKQANGGSAWNGMDWLWEDLQKFADLVAAQEREAIMKSIEELRPVEDNPLLQNKPAAFWIENFRQIVYARGEA
jgi:hypothetical protein